MSSPNSSNNNTVGSDKENLFIGLIPRNIFGNYCKIISSFFNSLSYEYEPLYS